MKNEAFINKIIHGDALEVLAKIESNSIDIVLTDPPYFLDKMDNNWKHKEVSNQNNQYVIKSLPAGMKFDREQGQRFYKWYSNISKMVFRLLKPGGFFFSFSSPRLYHRMASAIDDAGFEMRDAFIWLYTQNQAKAMGLNHFIDKIRAPEEKREEIRKKLDGWKTPQIKSCFEPIAIAQKPTNETYLENMLEHEVGLFNTQIRIGRDMFPSNVITVDKINELIDNVFLLPKPSQKEKGSYNTHKTVKPLAICEYLIRLTAYSENATILDPFVGSGTTAVAAKTLGKNYIGIDSNIEYVRIAEKRLKEIDVREAASLFQKEEKTSGRIQLELKVS